MKKPKRILSLLLSIILISGLLPVSAMAKEVNTLVTNAVCLFSGTAGETTEFTFTTGEAGVYRFDLKDTDPRVHGGYLTLYSGSEEIEPYTACTYDGDVQPGVSQSWNLSANTTYRLVHEPNDDDTTHHYSLKPTYAGAPLNPTLSAGQSAQINFLNVGGSCSDLYVAKFNVKVAESGFYQFDSASGAVFSDLWNMNGFPSVFYFQGGKEYVFYAHPLFEVPVEDTITLTAAQPQCLTLTESSPVTCIGGVWIKFTAASAGSYRFEFEEDNGGVDAINDEIIHDREYLYAELENRSMQAGETIYFRVTGGTLKMTVTKLGGPSEPDPEPPAETLTLVSSSPANGAVGFGKNDGLTLTFSQDISKNPDWTKGSIYIKNYATDSVALEIDSAKFYELGGIISGATMTIPGALKNLGAAKYYILIDAGLITARDAVGGAVAAYAGIPDKNELVFQSERHSQSAINGTFTYYSQITGKEASYDYSYDESWFLKSGTEYEHDLARMSIRMAMAAARMTSVSIEDLFDELGFDYSDESIVYPPPTRDSIGYAIGSKRILDENGGEFTLVAVAVRGGGYKDEWASNFTVGSGSEHKGFSDAGYKVASAVRDYISKNASDNVKVWIAGYSRAAATSNIAAQRLNEWTEAGKVNGLSGDGIYAYCFECPQGARTTSASYEKCYRNIHNIANDYDVVTKVAPKDTNWNFGRYGITYQIPSAGLFSGEYQMRMVMQSKYAEIVRSAYGNDISSFEAVAKAMLYTNQPANQGLVTDEIVTGLAEELGSPEIYTVLAEERCRSMAAKFSDDIAGNAGAALLAFVDLYVKWNTDPKFYSALSQTVLTAYTKIGAAHFPELCLAWMDTIDGAGGFADPRTRKLYVNCPVDVSVYDSSGRLVAQIVNNSAENSPEDGIPAFVDFDGQKIFMLPSGEEYRVKLTATGDGEMTYMVSEYDVNDGSTDKLVSYQMVPIAAGDELTGTVENLEQTTDAQYPLEGGSGRLEPTVKRQGDDIRQYTVTVKASGNGAAYGGGYYLSGEYTRLTAEPDSGASFLGWYVNGERVSRDAEYRMLVSADTEVTAKFTSAGSGGHSSLGTESSYTIRASAGANGSISPDGNVSVRQGRDQTFVITPDEGYVVSDVRVDGRSAGAVKSYTFENVKSGHTIEAVFMKAGEAAKTGAFADVPEGSYYEDAVLWAVDRGITSGTDATHFSPNGSCTRAQAVTFLWRAAGSPAPSNREMPFADVSADSYYYDAVLWALENDITKGISGTSFGPDETCTRAQIVTLLWRSQGAPAAGSGELFADVAADGYYADAVRWAVSESITEGTGDTTFSPDADCTRAQIVTFIWRAMK